MIGASFARRLRMNHSPPRPSRGLRLVGLATAIMTALAAGALWCAAVVVGHINSSILVVPCAIVLAWVLRRHGHAGTASGAVLALLLTLLATAYAYYLLAAVQLALMLGLPPRMTLLRIGPDMAWAVTRANLSLIDYVLVFAAALGAALYVGLLRPRGVAR